MLHTEVTQELRVKYNKHPCQSKFVLKRAIMSMLLYLPDSWIQTENFTSLSTSMKWIALLLLSVINTC